MDDLISKQDAIDVVSEGCQEWRGIFERCKEKLLSLPSAQPEIIYCGDCKHHHRDGQGLQYCDRIDYGYGWKDEDFCSRAERKE